jgi:hypothetical protein
MSNKVYTDKIRELANEIDVYEKSTPKPDNQLGWPDYIEPMLTKYEAIKVIVDGCVESYNEDMKLYDRRGGSKSKKTRKFRKTCRR